MTVCPLGAFGSDGQSRVLHRGEMEKRILAQIYPVNAHPAPLGVQIENVWVVVMVIYIIQFLTPES